MKDDFDRLERQISIPKESPTMHGLNASLLPGGALVMQVPSPEQALAFAAVCRQHDVRRVVDLCSAGEKSGQHPGPLDGGAVKPFLRRLLNRFSADKGAASRKGAKPPAQAHETLEIKRQGSHSPLLGYSEHFPPGDSHTRRVAMALRRDGKVVPGSTQEMSVIRMPVGEDGCKDSDRLFSVCLHLAQVEATEGGVTAFQSAHGSRAGVTYAVARSLMERFKHEEFDHWHTARYVQEECLKAREHHFGAKFLQADDLAVLYTFAERLGAAVNGGALRDIGIPSVPSGARPPSAERLPASAVKLPRSVFKAFEVSGKVDETRAAPTRQGKPPRFKNKVET
jgi:hypothetical protein